MCTCVQILLYLYLLNNPVFMRIGLIALQTLVQDCSEDVFHEHGSNWVRMLWPFLQKGLYDEPFQRLLCSNLRIIVRRAAQHPGSILFWFQEKKIKFYFNKYFDFRCFKTSDLNFGRPKRNDWITVEIDWKISMFGQRRDSNYYGLL